MSNSIFLIINSNTAKHSRVSFKISDEEEVCLVFEFDKKGFEYYKEVINKFQFENQGESKNIYLYMHSNNRDNETFRCYDKLCEEFSSINSSLKSSTDLNKFVQALNEELVLNEIGKLQISVQINSFIRFCEFIDSIELDENELSKPLKDEFNKQFNYLWKILGAVFMEKEIMRSLRLYNVNKGDGNIIKIIEGKDKIFKNAKELFC